ncbi:TPA: hypothetical protein ACW7Y0_003737 [Aeromonas hydrophila]
MPDWIKKVIPREGSAHQQMLLRMNPIDVGVYAIQPEIKNNRGPFGARKIRNVCGKCNGGWMSRLETKAKLKLTALMLGENTTLDSKDVLNISSWAMMTSIMAEYTDIPTQSIPESDRRHLMDNGVPPENWHIWIGSYRGEQWKQRYRHTGMALVQRTSNNPVNIMNNTQVSTFVIGSLLIHTSSSTVLNIHPVFDGDIKEKLVNIWPQHPEYIGWPFADDITDGQVMEISDKLSKQLSLLGGKPNQPDSVTGTSS